MQPIRRLETGNHFVGHCIRRRQFSGATRLRLYHGIVDHILALDLDDDVGTVFLLGQEVWIVASEGIGFGVDVGNGEIRLVVSCCISFCRFSPLPEMS